MTDTHTAAQPAPGTVDLPRSTRPLARARIYAAAFAGLLLRDARVLVRELRTFLVRIVVNPLLFVFVFTYVLPRTGHEFMGGGASFATIIVPGLVAASMCFQSISAVALPLATELSGTHEIEDRLMAPVPASLVAIEKITFSAAQSVLAAIIVLPLVSMVPATPVSIHVANWPLLVGVLLLASLTSGALGLTMGTLVPAKQIGLIFSMFVIPLTFLGCVYYPWASLAPVRWLQMVVLANPLVYISEGLRAALTPHVPHMPTPMFVTALVTACIAFTWAGVRGFLRRVVT